MSGVLIGLDPGGQEAFGWAIVEDSPSLPLRLLASGVADHAADATRYVADAAGPRPILAAGIDTPLYWVSDGDRAADARVREAICTRGSSGGTVQHVNSLRGACLVQGMMAALLLRRADATMSISEAHPKALLWLLEIATNQRHPSAVSLGSLSSLIRSNGQARSTEHERDAALGTISAWAMVHQPEGWLDLSSIDNGFMSPLEPPPGYWMPRMFSADRT